MKPTIDLEELAEIRGYLASMIDGEGTVQYVIKKGHNVRNVSISNTDTGIIGHVCYCLDTLGIGYWMNERMPYTRKKLYTVNISTRSGIQKLMQLPLQSVKLDRISEILSSYWEVNPVNLRHGFCQCGCGGRTTPSRQSIARDGIKKGEPRKFLRGHNVRLKGAYV
jgi:hypothetical protein